jgi:hypothetical protein
MLYAAAGSRVAFEPLIKRAREGLERCGVPYGQYFVTDALAGRLKSAKLQIFTSSFYAGTAEKVAIARHRKMQPDVTRVWCWAPGWLAERGRDDENIFRTTGFKARRIAAAHPKVKSTAAGKALQHCIGCRFVAEIHCVNGIFSRSRRNDPQFFIPLPVRGLLKVPHVSPFVKMQMGGDRGRFEEGTVLCLLQNRPLSPPP